MDLEDLVYSPIELMAETDIAEIEKAAREEVQNSTNSDDLPELYAAVIAMQDDCEPKPHCEPAPPMPKPECHDVPPAPPMPKPECKPECHEPPPPPPHPTPKCDCEPTPKPYHDDRLRFDHIRNHGSPIPSHAFDFHHEDDQNYGYGDSVTDIDDDEDDEDDDVEYVEYEVVEDPGDHEEDLDDAAALAGITTVDDIISDDEDDIDDDDNIYY